MITRGIESAAKGMTSLINYEDVIANNLANINTTGFKRTNITFKNVMDAQIEQKNIPVSDNPKDARCTKVGSLSLGSAMDRTYIDFSQGPLNLTGSKTDLGIQGEGFFRIRKQASPDNAPDTAEHYYYTRNGNFHLTQDYYLVNKEGDYVMDSQDRRIRIVRDPDNPENDLNNRIDPNKDLTISENGLIQCTNPDFPRILQTIKIVDFQDKTKVSSIGEGKFLELEGQDAGKFTKTTGFSMHQGMLEGANANTVNEMIHSINVSRSYETLSKLVKTQGDTISRAIELGKVTK